MCLESDYSKQDFELEGFFIDFFKNIVNVQLAILNLMRMIIEAKVF